ncbi:MAG TPA: radical SAM protein [bacterium]|nr:radical SAM protein [bacterium]HPN44585.1 radical SAM protein [bacterium]
MDYTDKISLLEQQIPFFNSSLTDCTICPRDCGVNRLAGEKGICRVTDQSTVYSSFLHQGEEPPITGEYGSGTIFFSGCNLRCIFCQNYQFSHSVQGKALQDRELADIMLSLQAKKAHNINLVTPTHVLPFILRALLIAGRKGLNLPIVYNTSGYEKQQIIDRLAGIVDIYLADIKYYSSRLAQNCAQAPDYFEQCGHVVMSMYEQNRPRYVDGIMQKGLIIRHLVMPGQIEDSKAILAWISENMPDTPVSVMFQYNPYYHADRFPAINRRLSRYEYETIRDYAETLDLEGWIQDYNPPDDLAGVYFEQDI